MTARKVTPPAYVHTQWSAWKLVGIVGTLGAALAAFPAFWTFSDHWMNRQEIEKSIKDHKQHDDSVQMWNQFGFADTRSQFLADHVFECDAKKMAAVKLAASDIAICSRYEAQLKTKLDEAARLKQQALESTKEK